MEGSCGQKSGAARECCCSCEGGSRRQVLEGGGGLTAGAEITKTGQGNAAVQDGITARGAGHDSNIQLTKRTNKKCKNLELRLQFCHFCYDGVKKICSGHLPDPNSFSSCWGWGSPQQLDERMGAVMVEECAE